MPMLPIHHALLPFLLCVAQDTPSYDPLQRSAEFEPRTLELVAADESRERELPLLVYLPAREEAAPVVLFSHGLGGSRHGSSYLGEHWSARGYVAVFLQHPGSDQAVWQGLPPAERMPALRKAGSYENFVLRARDVPAVLDQLESWNAEEEHDLAGRLDLEHIGMAGHSFGAVTTQGLCGQSLGRRGPIYADARLDAALIMSPSPARADSARAFGAVRVPWMLMTGTLDGSPLTVQDPATRLELYPHLPKTIDRYELVLNEAEHSAFGDRALLGETKPHNPSHHRSILALSSAYWDAQLRADPAARAWLHGEDLRSALQESDRWQCAAAGEDR